MSSLENGEPQVKYVFKGIFGARASDERVWAEPTKAEIDSFVREMLGVLDPEKKRPASDAQV
jgi:hypothetical protein